MALRFADRIARTLHFQKSVCSSNRRKHVGHSRIHSRHAYQSSSSSFRSAGQGSEVGWRGPGAEDQGWCCCLLPACWPCLHCTTATLLVYKTTRDNCLNLQHAHYRLQNRNESHLHATSSSLTSCYSLQQPAAARAVVLVVAHLCKQKYTESCFVLVMPAASFSLTLVWPAYASHPGQRVHQPLSPCSDNLLIYRPPARAVCVQY